jgi:DNA repair exonuclease SbcCD ATPase subunit
LLPSDTVHGATLDEDQETRSDEVRSDLATESGTAIPSPLTELAEEAADLINVESKLETIKHDIGSSWEQLNSWQSQLVRDASLLDKQERNLASRTEALDAKDAAIRGQLHDVTRFQEELETRERELAAQWRKFQEEKDAAGATKAECTRLQTELEQRMKDLARREHVLAQRWSRLQSTKCPHCGKPVNTPEGGTPKKK